MKISIKKIETFYLKKNKIIQLTNVIDHKNYSQLPDFDKMSGDMLLQELERGGRNKNKEENKCEKWQHIF